MTGYKLPRPFYLGVVCLLALLPLAAWQALDAPRETSPPARAGEIPAKTVGNVTLIGNLPPVAISHTFTITEDWIISVGAPGLLAGAFDPDGDPLTVLTTTTPAHGTLYFADPDGSFGYFADPDYYGADTFTYVISDGFLTDTAVVTMTVIPFNDVPLALDDLYTVTQDTPLNVLTPGVLSNDSDVEGDPMTAVLFLPPVTGTLTFNDNGSFTYAPPLGYTGVVTFVYAASDHLETAVALDGVDSFVDLGDSYENFADFSVEAWVYREFATGAYEEIFSKEVINSFSIDSQGHLHFNVGDGTMWAPGFSSIAPIPLNQWVHLAATWDSTTGETNLYINGQHDSTGTLNISVGDNVWGRSIGQKPGFSNSTFPGIIDDVRVWDRVLALTEIAESMWGELSGNEPGLLGYYKLNEGMGLIARDSAGSVDGTLTNFTPGSEWVASAHPFSNPAVVTIAILPAISGVDLTVPMLIATPKNVCKGEFFSLLFALANQGGLDAGAHQVYLYNDPSPEGFTNQTFIANIPNLPAGQTRYFSLSASSAFTGTRYLKAFVDGANVISETDETNNSAVFPLTVQPDPPPEGTLLINGGAASTLLPNLTLTINATDSGNCATSVAQMHFAYDGLTTPWEPYTTTKEIIVLSTGEVRVSVQFKDAHNNTSPWFDAVIQVGVGYKLFLPWVGAE